MNNEDDMSNTFVGEVGQKSAVFKEEEIETLNEEEQEKELFPEVKIDPPSTTPDTLKDDKEKEATQENKMAEEFVEDIKPKKEKKNHPFLTFLLMLLCLGIGAGASYYYFEVYSDKTKDEPKKEEKVEENIEQIQPTSKFINSLIGKYSNDFDAIETYKELYSKENMTVADLSNEYTQELGASNIRNNISFTNKDLQVSLDELFGSKKVQVEKKDIEFSKCYSYKYDDEEYLLKVSDTCNTANKYDIITKTVKAEKDTIVNELYVNVAVAVTDGNKMYKSYDIDNSEGKDEIVTLSYSSFDIEKDYTNFNQYKYTFKYNKEEDNYYLESIELIK